MVILIRPLMMTVMVLLMALNLLIGHPGICFTFFTFGAFLLGSEAIQVERIEGPQSIENGTKDVILECKLNYQSGSEDSLVIKWRFGNHPDALFQYIVNRTQVPRCSNQLFCPFLDLNYTVQDELIPYRAIRLVKPTTQLSGTYACQVESLSSFSVSMHNLTIYAPPKRFEFNVDRTRNMVTCAAEGGYPNPILQLRRLGSQLEILNSTLEIREDTKSEEGISVYAEHPVDNDLLLDNVTIHYGCILVLDNTNYLDKKQLSFQKGWSMSTTTTTAKPSAGSSAHTLSSRFGLLLLPVILSWVTTCFDSN